MVEHYTWALVLAGWSLLLLLGLAAGDPAATQQGSETPINVLARSLRRALVPARLGSPPAAAPPGHQTPRGATESGLHPAI